MTPPGSDCSIAFGTGLDIDLEPGRQNTIQMVVPDADEALAHLQGCAIATAGSGAVAGTASSTAPSPPPTTAKELGVGTRQDPVDLRVEGPLRVTFREITIPPGGSTGRHCNDGSSVGVVKSGTRTHEAPCTRAACTYTGPATRSRRVQGTCTRARTSATSRSSSLSAYVVPEGYPLAETDLSRCSR